MVVGGRELIDTLWNVNKDCIADTGISKNELIDTLWNVNNDPTKYIYQHYLN